MSAASKSFLNIAVGTFHADEADAQSRMRICAASTDADAAVASFETAVGMMKKMLAVESDREAAFEFFGDRLLGIPSVREAFAMETSDGLDVWVLVDEPYLDNEELVLVEVGRAMRRFPSISIDFLVLPSSSAPRLQRDATVLLVRR